MLLVLPHLQFAFRDAAFDQSMTCQPLNRPTFHAGVMERKPDLTQIREVQQRVLEPAERTAPGDGPLEQIPCPWIPHMGR